MKSIVALFADWANGIFAVLLAGWWFGVDPAWWHFVVGIVCSHLPDLDAVPELLTRGRVAASAEHPYDHREGLHYPLVIIVISVSATYLFPYWGLLIATALILHLINDLYGTGWGIKLFWPLSNRNYKLLGRRVNRLQYLLANDTESSTITKDEARLRWLVSWSPEELSAYMTRWGIDDWIPKYYGTLNWISGIEYGLFILALGLMIVSLVY